METILEDCLVESEDSEDEADLAAVKIVGPLTNTMAEEHGEDDSVPQIPNKGSRAFIMIEVKNMGPCIALMDSGSEVNIIRLNFMENKGQPYSISSSTKTLSCASGSGKPRGINYCTRNIGQRNRRSSIHQFHE